MAGMNLAYSAYTTERDIGRDSLMSERSTAAPPPTYRESAERAQELGEKTRNAIVDGTSTILRKTVRSVLRPVLIPVQTLGRRTRRATVSSVAKALPAQLAKAMPLLRKNLEEKVRAYASGTEDVNALLPPEVARRLRLAVELSEDALAPIRTERPNVFGGIDIDERLPDLFVDFSCTLGNMGRAVAQGRAGVADGAAPSTAHAPPAKSAVGGGIQHGSATATSFGEGVAPKGAQPMRREDAGAISKIAFEADIDLLVSLREGARLTA